MADVDFAELNTGTGGSKILVDALTHVNGVVATPVGVEAQRMKVGFGTAGLYQDVTSSAPLPVTVIGGSSSGLTDAQLRASPVPVSASITFPSSLAVTGTFWQATQPVSIAAPVNVTGTFWQATQPVSGTVTANAGTGTFAVSGPLTDTQLRAAAVPVSGTVGVSGSVSVTGTFWQATQPVSGAITANAGTGTFAVSAASLPLPTGAATEASLGSLSAKFGALGQATMAGSTPVVLASNQSSIPVTGTFWQATQPVNGTVTANAGSGTFAVSAATLPLPTGAATEAGLSTINTTLGSPFQAGASIGNTAFGISGTLPAYASTPTFNLGTIGSAASEATLAAVSDKLPALIVTNPSSASPAVTVAQRPVKIWSATFSMVGTFSAINPKFTQRRLGTGVTATQATSNLAIVAGTTVNAEFLARSVDSFNGAFIHRVRATLSQRIANNNFAVMLADRVGEGLAYNCTSATVVDVTLTAHGFTAVNVGQAMCLGGLTVTSGTGVPGRYVIASIPDANTIRFTVAGWATGTGTLDLFGWNYYRALYTGTTATNVNLDAQRQGWATGDTVATINTTASPGHILQLAMDGRSAYWSDTLAATSTTPTVTTRASRVENLPDLDIELFLYLWAFNGTSAPASSTTYTIGFVSIEDTVYNPVYLAGVRTNGQAAPLPVSISGTQAVSLASLPALAAGTNTIGNITRQSGFTDSSTVLAGAATFTGTGRASTGANYTRFVGAAFADQAGTLFIERSVDTGTTWRLAAPGQAVAANECREVSVTMTGAAGAAVLYRVRYVNGATLQGAFQITSAFVA